MHGRRLRGFTLLELLIVVVVTAAAMVFMLGVLQRARTAATTAQCASNQRLILQAVQLYASQNRGAILGSPWTSSAHLRTNADFSDPLLIPEGVTSAAVSEEQPGPVALFDWMTPVAETLRMTLPGHTREERYQGLVNESAFSCPANRFKAVPTGDTAWPIRPPSYRTEFAFLVRSSLGAPLHAQGYLVSAPNADVPIYYSPRLNRRLGAAEKKIFLLETAGQYDGKQLTYPTGLIAGQRFGGALSGPPPFMKLAFAGEPPSRLLRGNLADPTHPREDDDEEAYLLSAARHGSQAKGAPLTAYRMNVGFFDGHIETMNLPEVLKADYHAPSGTQIEITKDWVYPRVIQTDFKGRENGAYIVDALRP